eukprot:9258187-Pyramimonas_sp.AAC.1
MASALRASESLGLAFPRRAHRTNRFPPNLAGILPGRPQRVHLEIEARKLLAPRRFANEAQDPMGCTLFTCA